MADVKISDLPAVVTSALSDVLPVVQSATTKKATLTQVRAALVPIVLTSDVSGVLPTANGGWDATETEPLSNKTISGVDNTLAVRIANDVTGLGTGVATFLGTPSGANLATALTSALPDTKGGTGITALGTGVATFLGTPSGANLATALTSALPATKGGTGLTSLGTNVATFLGTPSGANLASALTSALPVSKGGTNLTALISAMAALAIDWSVASSFTKTLAAGGNTITFSNQVAGQVIVVRLIGAASTVTWPTVKWAGGTIPTQTASGHDVYTFFYDGTSTYGSVVQAMA